MKSTDNFHISPVPPEDMPFLFATWYTQISDYSANHFDFGEAVAFTDVSEEYGTTIPSFDNFRPTLKLCDQFLDGKVDIAFLRQVATQARADLEQAMPYLKTFASLNKGRDHGMPMSLMVFGYPLSLAELISQNVDSDGMVTGISPSDRKDIRAFVDAEYSALERYNASPRPR